MTNQENYNQLREKMEDINCPPAQRIEAIIKYFNHRNNTTNRCGGEVYANIIKKLHAGRDIANECVENLDRSVDQIYYERLILHSIADVAWAMINVGFAP